MNPNPQITPEHLKVYEIITANPDLKYAEIAEMVFFITGDNAGKQKIYRIVRELKLAGYKFNEPSEPSDDVTTEANPVTKPKATRFSLRQPGTLLVVVALFLLGNIKHTAAVYLSISPVTTGYAWMDWCYAILMMLSLDLAVLTLIEYGRVKAALSFSGSIFILTLLYFIGKDHPKTTYWLASIDFAFILAFGGWEFAHLFHIQHHTSHEQPK